VIQNSENCQRSVEPYYGGFQAKKEPIDCMAKDESKMHQEHRTIHFKKFVNTGPHIESAYLGAYPNNFLGGGNPVALHLGFTFCLLPMGIFHRKKMSGNFLNSESSLDYRLRTGHFGLQSHLQRIGSGKLFPVPLWTTRTDASPHPSRLLPV
jgi:hypothetical protein